MKMITNKVSPVSFKKAIYESEKYNIKIGSYIGYNLRSVVRRQIETIVIPLLIKTGIYDIG